MKKLIAVLCIVAILCSLCTIVSAASEETVYYGGDAVARIAKTYYQHKELFHYNDGNVDLVNYGIDCSTYASLCLRGIPYEAMRSIGNSFHVSNQHGWESGFDNHTKGEQLVYDVKDKSLTYNGKSVSTKILTYAEDYFNKYSSYMSQGSLYYLYKMPTEDGSEAKTAYYLKDKNRTSIPFVREYGSYSNGTKYYIKRAADIANYYARNPANIVYFNANYYKRTMTPSGTNLYNVDTKTGSYSSSTVSVSNLKPGDLVFWSSPTSNNTKIKQHTRFLGISHVAMVSIDGLHVYEAWSSGDAIRLTKLEGSKLNNIVLVIRPTFYKNISITASQLKQGSVVTCPGKKFVDMPSLSSYSHIPIDWAVESGITSGTSRNEFSPKKECTRAQIITFLWKAAGSPQPTSTNMPFTDVPAGSYYEKAVQWALAKGITGGTSPTEFSPDMICTRSQIVTFLWRVAGSPNVTGNMPFTDVAKGAYYYKAVLWAVKNNITSGISSTEFGSGLNCTREQAITFLYKLYKK